MRIETREQCEHGNDWTQCETCNARVPRTVSAPEVDALAKEYADWCAANGYGNYHPREFLLYYASYMTEEQLTWFRAWSERWVAATGSRL